MKKSLALSAFALVMVLPLVSAADRNWNIKGSGTVNFATSRNLVSSDNSPLRGVDLLFGSDREDTVTISTAAFPVIPEPGAALPMILGIGGLAVMGRKSRK
jgi:hypothetical protein